MHSSGAVYSSSRLRDPGWIGGRLNWEASGEGTVTEDDLRQLLYRRESETLDFKRDQYVFSKASEEQKANLLKDVLAFANAWRSTPAYILIGVDEKPQPRVMGIPEQSHLNDHELQRFVKSKISRPVLFGYQRVLFEGLHSVSPGGDDFTGCVFVSRQTLRCPLRVGLAFLVLRHGRNRHSHCGSRIPRVQPRGLGPFVTPPRPEGPSRALRTSSSALRRSPLPSIAPP